LWIFGWTAAKGIHLACIWVVAFATMLSAAFIMAANSWMQHPVGYVVNPVNHRAELTDVWRCSPTRCSSGATSTSSSPPRDGALLMLAVSAWHLRRGKEVSAFRLSATIALRADAGHHPGHVHRRRARRHRGRYQPMKIAAAEAQWTTCQPCSFSLFQIGGAATTRRRRRSSPCPTASACSPPTRERQGHRPERTERRSQEKYGPGNYVPNVFVQYWSMRVMAYVAGLVFLFACGASGSSSAASWNTAKWFLRLAVWGFLAPS